MRVISFEDLIDLCELNLGEKYVKDLVITMRSNDCLFHPGATMPNAHVASLYKLRLENAKENNMLGQELLEDYESIVSALLNIKSTDLALTILYSEEHLFTVFYEPVSKKILGVLKTKNNLSLKIMEEQQTYTVDKGLSSGFQKYSKGQFIRDWK